LLAALQDADLVLGSRYVPGGRVEDWPVHRLALSRMGNRYTRWLLRLPLTDATGGYRAARARLIDELPFDDVASQGYCFQVDWAWRAVRAGARVVEVPIAFSERTVGRSKMSSSIVTEALARVTWWGVLDRLADRLPNRVTRPVPGRARGGRRTRVLR
jgi:dolichol-phosphate mannosyltransferase